MTADPRDDPQYQSWLASQQANIEGAPVTEQPAAEAVPEVVPPVPDTAPETSAAEAAEPETGEAMEGAEGGDEASATQPVPDAGFETVQGSFTDQHPPVPDATAPHPSATNATPMLPASAQAASARAHVILREIIAVAEGNGLVAAMARAVQADLERFIPSGMLAAAEGEALNIIRHL